MDNLCIKKIYEYSKKYVLSDRCDSNIIKAWDFIDVILGMKSSNEVIQQNKFRISNYQYPCYCLPKDELINFDEKGYNSHIDKIIVNMNISIRRVMGREVPLGHHDKFFRPLFDPMEYISANEYTIKEVKYIEFIQFTGLEFFDLEKYYKGYTDINNIKIFFKTNVNYEWWRKYKFNYLDFSNPNGVDIILNALPNQNVLIYVNDIKLEKEDIFPFYNMIRKKELMWE